MVHGIVATRRRSAVPTNLSQAAATHRTFNNPNIVGAFVSQGWHRVLDAMWGSPTFVEKW